MRSEISLLVPPQAAGISFAHDPIGRPGDESHMNPRSAIRDLVMQPPKWRGTAFSVEVKLLESNDLCALLGRHVRVRGRHDRGPRSTPFLPHPTAYLEDLLRTREPLAAASSSTASKATSPACPGTSAPASTGASRKPASAAPSASACPACASKPDDTKSTDMTGSTSSAPARTEKMRADRQADSAHRRQRVITARSGRHPRVAPSRPARCARTRRASQRPRPATRETPVRAARRADLAANADN
jgi:hypothetical protein